MTRPGRSAPVIDQAARGQARQSPTGHDLPFMPQETHVGNDRSQGTADVPRRSNRSEEIYKAGAQRLVTPTTPRADRLPAVSEIEVGAIDPFLPLALPERRP